MQVARNAQAADPQRTVGLTAAATQLALAVALGAIASQASTFPNPPEAVPRPIALTLLYTLPGAVGAIGALRGQGALLGAAAAATAVGAFLAFSGITLIFLIPALLFAVAAGTSDAATPGTRWSTLRVALFVVVAIPLAFVAIVTWGIYAIVVLGLLVFIIQFARAGARMTALDHLAGLAVGLVIAGLMIGSGVALFATTETRCWTFHDIGDGIEYRETPVTSTITGGTGDQVGGSCNGGVLTVQGVLLASGLGFGAIAIAALVRQRP